MHGTEMAPEIVLIFSQLHKVEIPSQCKKIFNADVITYAMYSL